MLPVDECFLVVPHVDRKGSGPLVFGVGIHGASLSVAACAPDYAHKKETAPTAIENIFKKVDPTASGERVQVHVVNMSVRGAQANLPAGCWHAVRAYGTCIRVAY